MQKPIDPKEQDKKIDNNTQRTPEEVKQQQSDPNITELKGFVDPREKLEPSGTDNEFGQTS